MCSSSGRTYFFSILSTDSFNTGAIGINSGTVLAGIIGKGKHKNYSIFGEPLNHASNLKDLCIIFVIK